jgi:hypothetical protein
MKLSFKKYNWFNGELEKKYKRYTYITYALAVLAIVALYGLPGNLKMVSMLILVIGGYLIYKGTDLQNQDKQMRYFAQSKSKAPEKVEVK